MLVIQLGECRWHPRVALVGFVYPLYFPTQWEFIYFHLDVSSAWLKHWESCELGFLFL